MNTSRLIERQSNFLVLGSLFASFMCMFVLSAQGIDFLLRVKQVLFVTIPFVLGGWLLIKRHFDLPYIFASLLVVVYVALTRRVDAVAEWILLSWAFFITFFKPSFALSRKTLAVAQVVALMTIIGNFILFDRYGRESIGGLDPNYSALLIYCLVPFFLFRRNHIALISLLILGLITQSRGFLLATILLLSALAIQYFKFPRLQFRFFIVIFVISFLLLIAFSFYGVSFGVESYEEYRTGWDRILHIFNNASDYYRWKANTIFFDFSLQDRAFFLFGSTPANYLENRFIFLPHNLPLLELSSHGIFGLVYLFLFFRIQSRFYIPELFPFFIGLMSFWLFLGVELGSIYTVFIANLFVAIDGEQVKNEANS